MKVITAILRAGKSHDDPHGLSFRHQITGRMAPGQSA
jgi:hypothetical protein